ncbi:phosphatidate cytidylyltransferase [Ephemerocybe angulata]|uniref:Phosphatidate cytidylyltransferase n=1 Tax=Ephemerocybe angulata TaxID=980116 RepID=A0A8H6ICF1_9AGAR|nr:phosphatidate cytidylyltransferase [Tulosesus angulatus]
MSRVSTPGGRSLFASKLAYEALQIDSGEESEEELEEEVQAESSSPEEPAKLSKSAIKKAAARARIERRQQEKARAKAARAAGSVSPASPLTPQTLQSSLPAQSSTFAAPKEPLSAPLAPSSNDAEPTEKPAAAPKVVQQAVEEKPSKLNGTPVPAVPTAHVNGHSEPEVQHVEARAPSAVLAPRADSVTTSTKPPAAPKAPAPPSLEEKTTATVSSVGSSAPTSEEEVKKRQNVLERVVWTFIMIFGFIGLLLLGHPYMILLVMLCQTLVYREVTALFSLKSTDTKDNSKPDLKGKDPWSKTLNWYFFAVTNYFLYGESIIYYFKHVIFSDAQLLPFATNHRMISFCLYIIGFMGFVMSLKKGYLKQQFGLFCWVHMSLLIIVFSSHFIVNNILEGLIWFWVPASLVICNDCFAYIWGKLFGRTPLIKLSPKKTVEGFVGAFWSTLIFGVIWGTIFMQFDYMICPVHDLGTNAFNTISCKPNPIFVWRTIPLWRPLATILSTAFGKSITTMSYAPYQLHLLTLSGFASLVAPFGGFFASGFKRAFNIKDFGDSIPGHGGITDRMDCQFLMGVFTYVYYSSLIRENHVTVGGILQTIVSGLTVDEQLELIADLTRYLAKQGITIPRGTLRA